MSLRQLGPVKTNVVTWFILYLTITFGLVTLVGSGGGGDDDGSGDQPGTLQFFTTSYDVTEGTDGYANIIVFRSGGSDGAASVDFKTLDGSAVALTDYTAMNGTLTWPNGLSGNLTISVPITDDSLAEGPESFSVELSNVSAATLGQNSVVDVNIIDDD